jgi:hypothetical protein
MVSDSAADTKNGVFSNVFCSSEGMVVEDELFAILDEGRIASSNTM